MDNYFDYELLDTKQIQKEQLEDFGKFLNFVSSNAQYLKDMSCCYTLGDFEISLRRKPKYRVIQVIKNQFLRKQLTLN